MMKAVLCLALVAVILGVAQAGGYKGGRRPMYKGYRPMYKGYRPMYKGYGPRGNIPYKVFSN